MTMVGSRPEPERIWATMEVVEVFPWEPAMATPYFMRISSASISGDDRNLPAAGFHHLHVVGSHGAGDHHHIGPFHVLRRVPHRHPAS
jgi:hypothetical protein